MVFMSDPRPEPYSNDYERPRNDNDHLPGDHINHNATFWHDNDGGKHRESYNYDENGYMENLHHDNEPGPWNR